MLSRAKRPLTAMAQKEVCHRDEMVDPPGTKVFPTERHELRSRFCVFSYTCGVQSSPLR